MGKSCRTRHQFASVLDWSIKGAILKYAAFVFVLFLGLVSIRVATAQDDFEDAMDRQNCHGSAECPGWQHCLNGVCQSQVMHCYSDINCSYPEKCIGGVCKNAPFARPCSSSSFCYSWEHCLKGICQDKFYRCYSFIDCPIGESCKSGVCGRY